MKTTLSRVILLLLLFPVVAVPLSPETVAASRLQPITVEVGGEVRLDPVADLQLDRSTVREMVWCWGDGSISRGIDTSHRYEAPGVYYLRASYLDPSGRRRERITSVEVLSRKNIGLAVTANYECGVIGAYEIRGDSVWVEVDGSNEFNFRLDNIPADRPIYVHILGFSARSGRMADWRWTIYPDVTTFSKRAGNFRVFVRSSPAEPWEKFLDQSRFTIRDDDVENSFTLNRHQNWYYGGEGDALAESDSVDYLNISYHVTSEHPIDLYIVHSRDEFNDFSDNKEFTYVTDHFYDDETEMQGTCGYLKTYGGVILSNSNWKNTEVTIELTFYSHPSFYKLFENNTIRSYTIKDASWVVLEPTAGLYGYPGYDANVTGKKTAIDPVTKDYYYLN